jgi:hypothetical protein
MYLGLWGLVVFGFGRRPGVSRSSFCSRLQRPIGDSSSSGKDVRSRSVIWGRAVEELGFEGMK